MKSTIPSLEMATINLRVNRSALISALETHLGAKIAMDKIRLIDTTESVVNGLCRGKLSNSQDLDVNIEGPERSNDQEVIVAIHGYSSSDVLVAASELKSLLNLP